MNPGIYQSIRDRLKKAVHLSKPQKISKRFETSDIVQNGCIQVWQHIEENGGQNEIKSAWLRKVAFGHLCNFFRRNNAAKRCELREERHSDVGLISEKSQTPDSIVETRELAVRLLTCLGKLPDSERHVIVRRFFDGKSFDEIAGELKTTRYRVSQICQSTLQNLDRELSS